MPKIVVPDLDIYVRPAENADSSVLTPRLRDSDVLELAATFGPGVSTKEAVDFSIERSSEVYSMVLDGDVEALWGVADCPQDQYSGIPWLVGSDSINGVGKVIARYSKGWVEHLMRNYTFLYNFVHVPHWQSQKWLQLCGFTILEEHSYGFNGEDFYLFTKGAMPDVWCS